MMRQMPQKMLDSFFVPLIVWATLGVQVDVLSGPLTAENGLHALCGLIFSDAHQRCAQRVLVVSQSPPHSEVRHIGIPSQPNRSPVTLCVASWPFLLNAPSCLPPLATGFEFTRALTGCPSLATSPQSERQAVSPSWGDSSLPLQLCRLHC